MNSHTAALGFGVSACTHSKVSPVVTSITSPSITFHPGLIAILSTYEPVFLKFPVYDVDRKSLSDYVLLAKKLFCTNVS